MVDCAPRFTYGTLLPATRAAVPDQTQHQFDRLRTNPIARRRDQPSCWTEFTRGLGAAFLTPGATHVTGTHAMPEHGKLVPAGPDEPRGPSPASAHLGPLLSEPIIANTTKHLGALFSEQIVANTTTDVVPATQVPAGISPLKSGRVPADLRPGDPSPPQCAPVQCEPSLDQPHSPAPRKRCIQRPSISTPSLSQEIQVKCRIKSPLTTHV